MRGVNALLLIALLLLNACAGSPPRNTRYTPRQSTAREERVPLNISRFTDHSIGREEISIQAMSLVGVPYRWGGNTPASGFDCSGLVRYVMARAASVDLPRTTLDMSRSGNAIEPEHIAPGDLIFFNTTGRPHSHVGIYVGKLRFVNAPSTGGTVRLDYLTNAYWAKRFDGIRRMAQPLEPREPLEQHEPPLDLARPTPLDATPPPRPLTPHVDAFSALPPAVPTQPQTAAVTQHTRTLPTLAAPTEPNAADDDPIATFATSDH